MSVAKLTEKQKRFVQEYLVDLNATAAAKRAGYSEKTADRIGPELLGKTCVSAAIQEAIKKPLTVCAAPAAPGLRQASLPLPGLVFQGPSGGL